MTPVHKSSCSNLFKIAVSNLWAAIVVLSEMHCKQMHAHVPAPEGKSAVWLEEKTKWMEERKKYHKDQKTFKKCSFSSHHWSLVSLLSCLLLNKQFWQLWKHEHPLEQASKSITFICQRWKTVSWLTCRKLYICLPFQPKSGSNLLIIDSEMPLI